MKFLKDDKGQGAAEMILLFGGIIVVATAVAGLYFGYTSEIASEVNGTDTQDLIHDIGELADKF